MIGHERDTDCELLALTAVWRDASGRVITTVRRPG